jgi:tetratricopeptide (TPR) repeat protein
MRNQWVAVAIAAGVALGAGASPAQAQYREPDCDLSTGHFLVNSGVVYIKGAAEEVDPVKKDRLLRDARRNLLQAIDRGQADNPAVWYFMGRYYAMARDAVGADSAFDRAERLQPDCREDIAFYRRNLWVPLVNMALDSMQAGSTDAAKDLLRQANTAYQEDIVSFFYLASLYGNEGDLDSALNYFKQVAVMGTEDADRMESYSVSVFNTGLIHGMLEQWDSAAVWYRKYRDLNPSDPEGLTGLAQAYAQAGDTERAMVLYDSILANAAEMGALQLFQTGEKLFIVQRFDVAAQAFEAGLEKNPYFRPALYNVVNCYLAIAEDDSLSREERRAAAVTMESHAQRLVAVDPHNRESLRLLAAAYQLQRKQQATLEALERIEAMAFDVELDVLQETEGGFAVEGRLVNAREDLTQVPAITVEFLDAVGNVLAEERLESRTLDAGESAPFALAADGEEIVAARYTVGA